MYDLVIRNGLVVDGSGLPAYTADVAVSGDSIARIGKVADRPASRRIRIEVSRALPHLLFRVTRKISELYLFGHFGLEVMGTGLYLLPLAPRSAFSGY